MSVLADIVLVAATLTAGLEAGVFWLYWHAIMPGLRRTDDRTFVGAFQSIDRAIINPMMMACFFGALLLIGAAAILRFSPWIGAGLALYLVTVVITIAVNVPLNDAIKAAGDPDAIDVARVRRDFQEAKWVQWNGVRVVLSVAAFGCLLAEISTVG